MPYTYKEFLEKIKSLNEDQVNLLRDMSDMMSHVVTNAYLCENGYKKKLMRGELREQDIPFFQKPYKDIRNLYSGEAGNDVAGEIYKLGRVWGEDSEKAKEAYTSALENTLKLVDLLSDQQHFNAFIDAGTHSFNPQFKKDAKPYFDFLNVLNDCFGANIDIEKHKQMLNNYDAEKKKEADLLELQKIYKTEEKGWKVVDKPEAKEEPKPEAKEEPKPEARNSISEKEDPAFTAAVEADRKLIQDSYAPIKQGKFDAKCVKGLREGLGNVIAASMLVNSGKIKPGDQNFVAEKNALGSKIATDDTFVKKFNDLHLDGLNKTIDKAFSKNGNALRFDFLELNAPKTDNVNINNQVPTKVKDTNVEKTNVL